MKGTWGLVVAAVSASIVQFILHRFAADNLPTWLAQQMAGIEIKRPPYGLEVVIPALLTSLETGVALLVGYIVMRRAVPRMSVPLRALSLALLCLALSGNLVRMPVMQLVVGNPFGVTAVQHAAIWLPYVVSAFVVAYVYEWFDAHAA